VKLIPPVPGSSTRSSGERILFDMLARVDLPGWVAYHSLGLSQHEYKRWGELDFVVLSTEGLFTLEVKGGRISAHDGMWRSTDRMGIEHTLSESPFRQAETGLMGLRERLLLDVPSTQLRALAFGYGVVFPQMEFGVQSVEWTQETVLDQPRMSSPEAISKWLRALARHWQQRTHVSGEAPEELVQRVRDLLRPSFDRAPSLRFKLDEAIGVMERLTDEQYRQLDFIEDSPRLLCEGGAGTGKTFLAVEIARRSAARGSRVLVTCWSPVLAAFIRPRVPESVDVVPWDDLSAQAGPYDFLVLDEAQDVLTMEGLTALDGLIVNGLAAGKWAIFLDPNAQSAVRGAMEPDALELLRAYGGVPGRLRWNCRNTEPIVVQTRMLTGADLGNPTAGFGPPVQYVSYADRADCAKKVAAHLDLLAREGIGGGEVTILSPQPLAYSAAWLLPEKWRSQIQEVNAKNVSSMPFAALSYARIEEFKGLENNYVILMDVDRFDDTPRDVALVYVAMSRARAGLFVATHEAIASAIAAAATMNLEGAIADVGRRS
jgi:hypothetical protein